MATLVEREVVDHASESHHRPIALWPAAGVATVVVAGVLFRFVSRSDLWLDEALSVSIASLPLAEVPEALRRDGSPPLYYLLLHVWMGQFGTGDAAVRAFSGVASVATLPLLYLVGRRIAGPRVGWAALVLGASNPFALRYATETRMYSLMVLECVAGALFLLRALERPSPGRLAAVAGITASLVLTHYWALYLLATVGAWLFVRALRPGPGPGANARPVLAALAVGGLAFLPWLPSFLFQLAHTGTPWSKTPWIGDLVDVLAVFSGGPGEVARTLALCLFTLVGLALFARPLDDTRVELCSSPPGDSLALAGVVLVPPALAVVAGSISGTPFIGRYLAVVLAPFLLLAARGTLAFRQPRSRHLVLAVVAFLGLSVGNHAAAENRTQAGEVARAIADEGAPGDVVAFCPDQLGPAVNRLLDRRGVVVTQVGYPRGVPPVRIDWTDYPEAIRNSSPQRFARTLVEQAGPAHDVWLYWGRGYRPFDRRCAAIDKHLTELRSTSVLVRHPKVLTRFEHGTLTRYPAP